MQNSKLIILLKALNADEFRQFYRYLKTPFFTKSKEVVQFYDYIRKFYPNFSDTKLDRTVLFAALYPNEKFNGPRLRNLMLKITKILEEYFIYLEYQQNDFQKKKLLTHIYGKRNINVIYEQKTKELLTHLDEQVFRDGDYFHDNFVLQRDYYFHIHTPKQGRSVETLRAAWDNFYQYTQLERLKMGIEFKNRTRIYAECHQLDRNTNKTESSNVTFTILKKIDCLLEQEDATLFKEAKDLFLANTTQISPKDSLFILPILLNYAIQNVTKEESKYLQEIFELYKFGLSSQLILVDGKISEGTFLNIVIMGAKLKAYDFVEKFLIDYEGLLNSPTKEDLKTLAQSFLLFHQAQYRAVIDLLQQFAFQNVFYKLNAKSLLLRTYYTLYETDSTYYPMILSNCDAFEKLIRRTTIIHQDRQNAYLNFVLLLRKLTKIRYKLSFKKSIQLELRHLLNNFKEVIARDWIENKLNNLRIA